ncbi:MAG TPA: DUF3570 domain-containing protein [Steroidobacteraceae bacterium]
MKDPEARKVLPLRRQLMAASCALLSAAAVHAEDSSDQKSDPGVLSKLLNGVSLDTALAYYHEDGRVQAVEPVVDVNKAFANGQSLNLDATFDVLSGASPNGALTSRQPQTFASPSGTSLTGSKHSYIVNPGQYPVDRNYSDVRGAAGANWNVPLTRLTSAELGAKISGEDDFISATLNASVEHDFNEKNTTLSFGISNEFDRLSPIGGTPVAGSDYSLFEKTGNKTKNGVEALFGVTQVMTQNWIAELNFSADRFKGYLNDPYKIASVLDPVGNTTGYVYESRPEQRTRKSVFLENRTASDQFSAALSLRYMQDNWQIRSDTVELRPRWTLSDRNQYLEPTVRWYRQTAAYFYTPWLSSTVQVPEFQASDERLGAFHALTYGIKYAHKVGEQQDTQGSELSVRVEYYQQTFRQPEAPLSLQGLDLLPPLKAVLVQVGWRF